MIKGRIHSIQSLGAVDGPGLRSVVFFQGCPLRCNYCHNPDTWNFSEGEEISAEEIITRIKKFLPYIKKGGVTLSGGECLAQPDFCLELLKQLKAIDIHTAIDTSGICNLDQAAEILKYTDLVICDLKFDTKEKYLEYSKANYDTVLSFLNLTKEMNVPLWIRHVIIPDLTDSEEAVRNIISKAKTYDNLKKIELLPFRKICLSKYENLGIDFPLKHYNECSKDRINQLSALIDNEYK